MEPVKQEGAAAGTSAAFDLSALSGLSAAQEEGFDVSITHPKSGEPLGITVRVAGPDSKRVKSARAIIVNERSEMRLRKISADRMEDESNRITAASIISWSGVIVGGKTWECSPQAAYKLMVQWPFIREQIDAFVGDRANFIKS